MTFEYKLTGTGWGEATISHDGQTATATVSYLTQDALGDLLAAVSALFGDVTTSSCSWAEEPGEYEWSFRRVGDDVAIKLTWFDDWRETTDSEGGKIGFKATVDLRELADAVATAAERLLADVGEDGYDHEWAGDPFPSRQLQRLRTAIAAAGPPAGGRPQ